MEKITRTEFYKKYTGTKLKYNLQFNTSICHTGETPDGNTIGIVLRQTDEESFEYGDVYDKDGNKIEYFAEFVKGEDGKGNKDYRFSYEEWTIE